MNIHTVYKAELQDDVHGLVNNVSKNIVADYIKDKLSIPTFDLLEWNYTQEKNTVPSITEMLEVKALHYATISGKRIFITPNILNRYEENFNGAEKRLSPLYLRKEFTDIDSIEIQMPANYVLESNVEHFSLQSKFGNYSRKISYTNGKISYIRTFEKFIGIFPASDAVSFAEFLKAISKADKIRVVLTKNSEN